MLVVNSQLFLINRKMGKCKNMAEIWSGIYIKDRNKETKMGINQINKDVFQQIP